MSDLERVMIFVDGSNLSSALRKLRAEQVLYLPMFRQMCAEVSGRPMAVHYFDSTSPGPKRDTRITLFRALARIPKVHLHIHERVANGNSSQERGVDVDLAAHMTLLASTDQFDIAILVSGDQDFVPVVKLVRDIGKRVFIITGGHGAAQCYHDDNYFVHLEQILRDMRKSA
ncbi:NYN domain-containing protein [Candidatus Uhrbacteria bacterium]|nr:NYN domain-containing protein [Candidatus Uhrbacteria bacterium]MBT7717631.1 NYN domain-containing protein [Candidatus Uhrbacteria bacterium]